MGTYNCKLCNFCKWIHLFEHTEYYDLNCTKDGNNRNIVRSAKPSDIVSSPIWCPKESKPAYSMWVDLKPNVEWSTIKKGNTYHIPPYNGISRKNIKVLDVRPDYFTYMVEGGTDVQTMYPEFIAYKVMVEHRSLNIKIADSLPF